MKKISQISKLIYMIYQTLFTFSFSFLVEEDMT